MLAQKLIAEINGCFSDFSPLNIASGYPPRWQAQRPVAVITQDVSGYYLYLLAILIYHDLQDLRFHDQLVRDYAPTPEFYQVYGPRSAATA